MPLTDKIAQVLEDHEPYTVIRYSDDDFTVGYECKCGAKDTPEVWGRKWLIAHLTEEIIELL